MPNVADAVAEAAAEMVAERRRSQARRERERGGGGGRRRARRVIARGGFHHPRVHQGFRVRYPPRDVPGIRGDWGGTGAGRGVRTAAVRPGVPAGVRLPLVSPPPRGAPPGGAPIEPPARFRRRSIDRAALAARGGGSNRRVDRPRRATVPRSPAGSRAAPPAASRGAPVGAVLAKRASAGPGALAAGWRRRKSKPRGSTRV